MSLESLLTVKRGASGADEDLVTEEGLSRNLPALRDAVSYWRCYPDRFVDFLASLDGSSNFKFKDFQRVMLRAIFRHRYVYVVMTRGTSKSFISVMAMMVKAVLYPRCKLFVASGNKEQSATIVQDKVSEICNLVPAFRNEIVWDTRAAKNVSDAHTRQNKDSAVYSFKNGSTLCNVVAGEQTRGRRFQCGLIEECINVDQDILQQVLIPETRSLWGTARRRAFENRVNPRQRGVRALACAC